MYIYCKWLTMTDDAEASFLFKNRVPAHSIVITNFHAVGLDYSPTPLLDIYSLEIYTGRGCTTCNGCNLIAATVVHL